MYGNFSDLHLSSIKDNYFKQNKRAYSLENLVQEMNVYHVLGRILLDYDRHPGTQPNTIGVTR